MGYKLWLGVCIVCIIILTISLSLIGLYGFDVFDYTDDTYNQYATMALFGLGIVSAIGLYVSAQQMSATANRLSSKEFIISAPIQPEPSTTAPIQSAPIPIKAVKANPEYTVNKQYTNTPFPQSDIQTTQPSDQYASLSLNDETVGARPIMTNKKGDKFMGLPTPSYKDTEGKPLPPTLVEE